MKRMRQPHEDKYHEKPLLVFPGHLNAYPLRRGIVCGLKTLRAFIILPRKTHKSRYCMVNHSIPAQRRT